MENFIEKSIFASLGVFLFAQEKISEAVGDSIDQGRLAPEEGRRFLEDISKKFDDNAEDVKKKFQEIFESGLASAGVATVGDVKEIKAAIARIEDRFESLKHE